MGAQGFDAKAIGDVGGASGKRPPPPTGGEPQGGAPGGSTAARGSVDSVAVSLLSDLIDSYGDVELTEGNWTTILKTLQGSGVDTSKSMVDLRD